LSAVVYHTFYDGDQMTVKAIESQAGVTLEVAQNRLLEEWRKRKDQSKGGGLWLTALHSSIFAILSFWNLSGLNELSSDRKGSY